MRKVEMAVDLFKQGFSCSQAVLSTFADLLGLSRLQALKIASGFGGGIACRGDICGAVSGAIMAIGLQYGRIEAADIDAREKTYGLIREFINQFESEYGSIYCRELLGADLGTPEGKKKINDLRLAETSCPHFVGKAVKILTAIFSQEKNLPPQF